MTTVVCRCGSPFDSRGVCPHCDRRVLCPADCYLCRQYDRHCYVCWSYCESISAAVQHAKQCRRIEEAERKPR